MLNRMEFDHVDRTQLETRACEDWGALLPDAAEDLLDEAETRALALHLAGCPACEAELAEARRGAAWLSLLKGHTPEPSHDLVAGILARTTGSPTLAEAMAETVAAELLPVPVTSWSTLAGAPSLAGFGSEASPVRRWMTRWLGLETDGLPTLQPRLTMTAATAFLSICITLNLLGISVTQLHAQDLHSGSLQRTMAGKGASVLRSLEGLRVVYRVQSQVDDWLTAGNAQDHSRTRQ